MPQISQIGAIYVSQAFWLLVVFGLIYVLIGRAMLPKIMTTVDQRSARVAGDLAAAEAARAAADMTEAAWRESTAAAKAEAQAATAAAKAKAGVASEVRVKAADVEAARRLSHAEAAIMAQTHAALSSIEEAAAEAAQAMVAKLSGATVDIDAARAAVGRAMAHG